MLTGDSPTVAYDFKLGLTELCVVHNDSFTQQQHPAAVRIHRRANTNGNIDNAKVNGDAEKPVVAEDVDMAVDEEELLLGDTAVPSGDAMDPERVSPPREVDTLRLPPSRDGRTSGGDPSDAAPGGSSAGLDVPTGGNSERNGKWKAGTGTSWSS